MSTPSTNTPGSDTAFLGTLPANYERYLVPLIFEPYAEDIVAQTAARRPKTVLETASGTGVVTRRLLRDLPGTAAITGTDLNQAMIDFASATIGAANLNWRQADATALPFADASFDTVVCQFGAMFFPDRGKGYREALRVLRPGGALLFNVWDRLEANAFARSITDALAALFPLDPPRFLARTPHGYHEAERIGAELRTAGFREVRVETLPRTSRAANARDVALGYCRGTPLAGEIEARAPGALARVTEQVTAALAQRHGAGVIEGAIQAHRFIALH